MRLLHDTGVVSDRIKRLQIMFMSMGEPLLNLKALIPAIEQLHVLYPQAALLISTSAPTIDYEPVRELSMRVPTVGLQFSVHESTDHARDKLIPFRHKLSLSEIAVEGQLWYECTARKPFFNYCAHDGNVSDFDAENILNLFDPRVFNATISVICERDEHVAAANKRQEALACDFSAKLIQRGYNVRVFNPAGQDDIGGGCGQLWFVQDWMTAHPELAHASVGRGLVKIHTPS
jgi:23S rRNA (adenine2503-C2)-methyltransferase